MTANTIRRNPMTEVMPFELLSVAHDLVKRGQNERYWAAVPAPKRPIGRVRHEVARQVSTFAIPLLVLLAGGGVNGVYGLAVALPVALLVGYLLDLMLMRSIAAKRVRDNDIDRGRYQAVKWLSAEMGMAPAEVTLDTIKKMSHDYLTVESIVAERKVREAAALKEELVRTSRRYNGNNARRAGNTSRGYSRDDADAAYTPPVGMGGMVNPATGLPMVGGTYSDSNGNVFGQNNTL